MIQMPCDLVCFSNMPWSTTPGRTQALMKLLAKNKNIHRVTFVNPEVWLTQLIFNFREQLSSTRPEVYKSAWKAVIPQKVGDKILVVTPFFFIPFARTNRYAGRLQRMFHGWFFSRLLRQNDYIFYMNDYNSDSFHKDLISLFCEKAKLVVYDWSDDFVENFEDADQRKSIGSLCEYYIKKSHVVLTVNESLTERARKLNPHSYTVLNGTDFGRMSMAFYGDWEVPRSLQSLSKPIIGYFGTIHALRMDSELLTHLSLSHPDWTILLIGPVRPRFVKSLEAHNNIVFLPPVAYHDLPRYLKFFDVCIIPHKVNDHTRGNDPIKIYDYLASGKPVVTTAVSGVERFKNVVYVANDKEDFTRWVERALQENDPELQKERLKRARENSWLTRSEEFWKIMENHLVV